MTSQAPTTLELRRSFTERDNNTSAETLTTATTKMGCLVKTLQKAHGTGRYCYRYQSDKSAVSMQKRQRPCATRAPCRIKATVFGFANWTLGIPCLPSTMNGPHPPHGAPPCQSSKHGHHTHFHRPSRRKQATGRSITSRFAKGRTTVCDCTRATTASVINSPDCRMGSNPSQL